MNDILSHIACPSCGLSLSRVARSLVCEKRHTFDLAKSGYVNLLPPGKGKNSHTGDERAMVDARVDFLKRGFYNPISDTAGELFANSAHPGWDEIFLCDMGAGEGWHTCRIVRGVADLTGKPTAILGMDASKYAAERGAKLAKSLGLMPKEGVGAPFDGTAAAYFAPANIFHTPLVENSVHGAFSMFAPVAWDEAARILRDDGLLLVISSGREHLLELRQLIYSDVRLADPEIAPTADFTEVAKHTLRYTVTLPDRECIRSLFTMTPFYYKTTEEGRTRLLERDSLDVTVEVVYTLYRKA